MLLGVRPSGLVEHDAFFFHVNQYPGRAQIDADIIDACHEMPAFLKKVLFMKCDNGKIAQYLKIRRKRDKSFF